MNDVRYDRLLHSYCISMFRHRPAVSNLLACGLYNVVTLLHYTAGLTACLLVKTLQVDPFKELGVPRACRNHNSLCAYLNFKSPSHDHYAYHISVIKHCGYYLFNHVIYCSYYLRVVTNKGWCLLHLP